MRAYIVQQGDYLSKLAARHRFDAQEVWNHPQNADLRQLRPNPELLAPGDLLYLPDEDAGTHPISAGGTFRFTAHLAETTVSLSLNDEAGEPVAGLGYSINGRGEPTSGQTDANGNITITVPVNQPTIDVALEDGRVLTLLVGEMDPPEDASGVAKRLANLGYCAFDRAHLGLIDRAIAAFQRDHGLEPSGEIDEATRAALLETHQS